MTQEKRKGGFLTTSGSDPGEGVGLGVPLLLRRGGWSLPIVSVLYTGIDPVGDTETPRTLPSSRIGQK